MATIHQSIDIDAPVERIFEMLTDPKRLPEYVPGVISVEDIQQTEQHLGDSFHAMYAVLGLHFPMTFTATAYEHPTKLTMRSSSHWPVWWSWRPVAFLSPLYAANLPVEVGHRHLARSLSSPFLVAAAHGASRQVRMAASGSQRIRGTRSDASRPVARSPRSLHRLISQAMLLVPAQQVCLASSCS